MDPLRLILLFMGLAIIAGLYLYYRDPKDSADLLFDDKLSPFERIKSIFKSESRSSGEDDRIGPKISDEDFEQLGPMVAQRSADESEELDEEIHIGWDDSVDIDPGEEVVLVFHVLAHEGKLLSGTSIRDAAEQTGFSHGAMQIFHFFGNQKVAEGNAICSIANAIEPGNFDLANINDLTTPGISLFMQLPGPIEGRQAFELTINKAKEIAGLLDSELCDESRNILTEQSIGHMKEKVEAFRFKQQVAAMKQRRHDR